MYIFAGIKLDWEFTCICGNGLVECVIAFDLVFTVNAITGL